MKYLIPFLAVICIGYAHAKDPPVSPTVQALQCAYKMETDVIRARNLWSQEDVTEFRAGVDASRACADEALRRLPKNRIRAAFAKVESRYSLVLTSSSQRYEQEFAIAVADLRAAAR